MDMITSRANPKIKQARALRQRKERDASGLFLVEGISHVGAAIEAKAAIEYICCAPDLLTSEFGKNIIKQANNQNIQCFAVSVEVFESISEKDNPSGLLALIRKPTIDYRSLMTDDSPRSEAERDHRSLYVALLSPQDPGNIGAILRTVEAVGASGLILLDGGADPYHPNAVRASMGALFYKPVISSTFAEFSAWTKQNGYPIIGTSAKADTDYRAANYELPLVLLLGSEQKGLLPEQRAACDQLIRLPIEGKVSSLNLAVAAGVLLYEIRGRPRQ